MYRTLIPIVILAMTACADSASRTANEINALADSYVSAWIKAFPDAATFSGVADAPHDQLPDISPEALERWYAFEEVTLDALNKIALEPLPENHPARITHGFLQTTLQNSIGYRACRMELWNVSPTWTGWPSAIGSLAEVQPTDTPRKREMAVQRFTALPRYLDQEIANLREGIRQGYTAPRHNVHSVIAQVETLLSGPADSTPWVIMAPDSLPEFRQAMVELHTSAIRPAMQRYLEFLRTEYVRAARTAVGVSALPGGTECYAAAVRYHATVDMSPEDVHNTGLEQMRAIRDEMQELSRRLLGHDDIGRALEQLRSDQSFLMGSRENVLDVARSAVQRSRDSLPRWFGRIPSAGVIVEPVPSFAEASAPGAFYTSPAEDGSRPGRYSINLYQAETRPRAGIEATAFHEAYPGHHLQIAIAMEREGLHAISRYLFLSGFGEGWALYTERLSDEMGLYTSDVDRFGMLSNEALRAARLVVDAGMHALGWSRDQAIAYMLQNTAESESSVTAEVDRYIAVPGQATAYMLGSLEIRRLRTEAERTLGDRFDIRDFHDRVLEDGAVPLQMLRNKMSRWLADGG